MVSQLRHNQGNPTQLGLNNIRRYGFLFCVPSSTSSPQVVSTVFPLVASGDGVSDGQRQIVLTDNLISSHFWKSEIRPSVLWVGMEERSMPSRPVRCWQHKGDLSKPGLRQA